MTAKTALITGASTGIGAIYADRFAKRGHDLVLVARNVDRMEALATTLRSDHGITVDIMAADLADPKARSTVEARLRDDDGIGILINNAGISVGGEFVDQSADDVERMVTLNTTALVRLAHAVAPRLSKAGEGAIVNIGSVVGLLPEFGTPVYGGSKAFVLHFSQSLGMQLGPKGVYVQAVLPAVTRTELWGHAGVDVTQLSGVMEVGDLVDAALIGFDRKESVTIPPLHNESQWIAFEGARQAMLPSFSHSDPAERYTA